MTRPEIWNGLKIWIAGHSYPAINEKLQIHINYGLIFALLYVAHRDMKLKFCRNDRGYLCLLR
jgi:hypothetical protein